MNAILSEFQDIFGVELGLIIEPPEHLKLKKRAVPKSCNARSLPFALPGKLFNKIDRVVMLGILSHVMHAEWVTPIQPVLKKDGIVRTRGNFKVTLNTICKLKQYPLQVTDGIFACLNGGDYFSTLYLQDAYCLIASFALMRTQRSCALSVHPMGYFDITVCLSA